MWGATACLAVIAKKLIRKINSPKQVGKCSESRTELRED